MKAPTPQTYLKWIAERDARTVEFMRKYRKITGRQVKENELSVKMLCDNGYVFDVATDTLEKVDGK